MRILVLGHNGMLGNCVLRYLEQFHEVDTIDLRFPDKEFLIYLQNYRGIIINCIGAVPQKTDRFEVNHKLPEFLSALDCRVVHPGTDCESDDTPYGRSKRSARYWAINSNNTKILKTSIIGLELNSNDSLLSWFLSQKEVDGYTLAMWNGVTTLEWVKYCHNMIQYWGNYNSETILQSDCISKYELLGLVAKAFQKKIKIKPIPKGKDKCLQGIYTKPIYQQLKELKAFYE